MHMRFWLGIQDSGTYGVTVNCTILTNTAACSLNGAQPRETGT